MVKNQLLGLKRAAHYGIEILQDKMRINNSLSFIGNIYFGSPLNKCTGHGICEIHKISEERDIENCFCHKNGIALISIPNNNRIRVEILKSSMSASLWHQDFNERVFQVDSDYCFSPVISGFKGKRIQKGAYQYYEDSLFVTINF